MNRREDNNFLRSKRIEIETKKYRGSFVKKRKVKLFYQHLVNYVRGDVKKEGILRKYLLPN